MNPVEPPCRLIALSLGLPPHADPINCGDLTGPSSVFGAFCKLPKPLYSDTSASVCALSGPECAALRGAQVLYDSSYPNLEQSAFIVPQTTYVAGSVSSTFDVAWRLVTQGLFPEWGAVVATRQVHGRGQMRRPWHAPAGNLSVTFRLPQATVFQTDAAAVAVGLMLARALERLEVPVLLKWPNDLLSAAGAKVGGILVEERDGVSLVGLGINIHAVPEDEQMRSGHACAAGVLPRPGLLPEQAELTPFWLWQRLVRECMHDYSSYFSVMPFEEMLQTASGHLAWKNERVVVSDDDMAHRGICLGLGTNGGLLLRLDSGEVHEMTSGSVCWDRP